MADSIRVLVVDDHPIVRSGMATAIGMEPDMEVVGEAKDGLEAVEKSRQLRPDVIVMDLVMPEADGVQAIAAIMQHEPAARILVLTSFGQDEKILAAVRAGAAGYLLKDSLPAEVTNAIRAVYEGEAVLPARMVRKLMQEQGQPTNGDLAAQLTGREREVLSWVARGLQNKEIALKVQISEATVRSHVRNIFAKLNLSNRSQVVLYAVRHGLVDEA